MMLLGEKKERSGGNPRKKEGEIGGAKSDENVWKNRGNEKLSGKEEPLLHVLSGRSDEGDNLKNEGEKHERGREGKNDSLCHL